MAQIKIPHEHFIKSAKAEYADHQVAIFRESIQNSVDAGADTITIEVGDNCVTVEDNGVGMDSNILESALLTLSGTFKREGSIGGFGSAKTVLLFQHESYKVSTRDLIVVGSGVNYELTSGNPHLAGTKLEITFHKSYNFNKEEMLAKAIVFLSQCYLPDAYVTLNGSTYAGLKVTTKVNDLEWGAIYCDDCEEERSEATVRINGVKMFSRWIGSCNKNIIIDITKPSIEILTSNRDNFNWAYGSQVEKIIQEMIVDKSSFGRLHNTVTKYTGNNRYSITNLFKEVRKLIADIQEAIVTASARAETILVVNEVETKLAQGAMSQDAAIALLKTTVVELDTNLKFNVEQIIAKGVETDFYVQIDDKGFDKIPTELAPETMKLKYKNLAKLWKAAIKQVAHRNGIEIPYCIGFIISRETQALYMQHEGITKLLINPYTMIEVGGDILPLTLLMTAAHELTHRRCKYHDETFMMQYDRLLCNALSDFSPRKLREAAKLETI